MDNLGPHLRKLRRMSGLTLDQLALASRIDRGSIDRIELGRVSPRVETIEALCQAMGLNLTQFFAGWASGDPEGLPSEAPAPPPPPAPVDLGLQALEAFWPVPGNFWQGIMEVLGRFETLLNSSRELIMVLDPEGSISFASARCQEVLGVACSDLGGLELETLLHPDDHREFHNLLEELPASAGAVRNLELRIRDCNGQWRWLSARFSNQLQHPSIKALVVNAVDLQGFEKTE